MEQPNDRTTVAQYLYTLSARQWLMIDAVGAAVSAFLLYVVLPSWQPQHGIPLPALKLLARIPVCFVAIDLYGIFIRREHHATALRFIAVCNLLYCLMSLGVALYYGQHVRIWGWAYLLGEVAVVYLLARWEFRVAAKTEFPPHRS